MFCFRYLIVNSLHKGDNNDNNNTAHVECKSDGDTGNNWSDWDHLKITMSWPNLAMT
jgi:hypothetical protein